MIFIIQGFQTIVFIVGVSWGVVARTCLILLSTFLYNFRPASFPAASYIHNVSADVSLDLLQQDI